MEPITITVYGAEQICASCVGAPGSNDTYEWLQAAIGRKYADDAIGYVDTAVYLPPAIEQHEGCVNRVLTEVGVWPVVFVDDELVAEGVPRLQEIYAALDKKGGALKT